jgi:hypothetical protein
MQAVINDSTDKIQCGRKHIAESYVLSFFPEISLREYENKVSEIEHILSNGGNEQIDHRTLSTGVYGNSNFFSTKLLGPQTTDC